MDKNKRPKLYTLPDTLPAAGTIYPARPVWYLAQTGATCPTSGCAGVGRGAPAGYIAAAQPCPVSLSTTEKIKKAQK